MASINLDTQTSNSPTDTNTRQIKVSNPPPSNFGRKWTETEERQLFLELEHKMPLENIAQRHNRTPGGITSRIREIVYRLHADGASLDEIINKTKLEGGMIRDIIGKRITGNNTIRNAETENNDGNQVEGQITSHENNNTRKSNLASARKTTRIDADILTRMENEITMMRSEIKELKTMIEKLIS